MTKVLAIIGGYVTIKSDFTPVKGMVHDKPYKVTCVEDNVGSTNYIVEGFDGPLEGAAVGLSANAVNVLPINEWPLEQGCWVRLRNREAAEQLHSDFGEALKIGESYQVTRLEEMRILGDEGSAKEMLLVLAGYQPDDWIAARFFVRAPSPEQIALERETAAILGDGRITSFFGRNAHGDMTSFDNGFKVAEMPAFDPDRSPAHQDEYHMYTVAGMNASNTSHHSQFGDVNIFYSETAPVDGHGKPVEPDARYVIIVDSWTGKRIKVVLPPYQMAENPVENEPETA